MYKKERIAVGNPFLHFTVHPNAVICNPDRCRERTPEQSG